MNTLSMKMVKFLERKVLVLVVPTKLIHGGDGYFGIAVTVSVCVTNKDQNPIVILVYVKQQQIHQLECKCKQFKAKQKKFLNIFIF